MKTFILITLCSFQVITSSMAIPASLSSDSEMITEYPEEHDTTPSITTESEYEEGEESDLLQRARSSIQFEKLEENIVKDDTPDSEETSKEEFSKEEISKEETSEEELPSFQGNSRYIISDIFTTEAETETETTEMPSESETTTMMNMESETIEPDLPYSLHRFARSVDSEELLGQEESMSQDLLKDFMERYSLESSRMAMLLRTSKINLDPQEKFEQRSAKIASLYAKILIDLQSTFAFLQQLLQETHNTTTTSTTTTSSTTTPSASPTSTTTNPSASTASSTTAASASDSTTPIVPIPSGLPSQLLGNAPIPSGLPLQPFGK